METQQWTSYIKKVINKTEENKIIRKLFDSDPKKQKGCSPYFPSNERLSAGYSLSSIDTNDSVLKRVTLNLSANQINDSGGYLTPISNPKFLLSTKKYDLPESKRVQIITIKNNKKNLDLNDSLKQDDSIKEVAKQNYIEAKLDDTFNDDHLDISGSHLYMSIKSSKNSLNDIIEEDKELYEEMSIENISKTSSIQSDIDTFGNLSPIPKSGNDKFIINLYESRALKTLKRNICKDNNIINSSEIIIKDTPNLIDLSLTDLRSSNFLNVVSSNAIYDMIREIMINIKGNSSEYSKNSIDSFINQNNSTSSFEILIRHYRNEIEVQRQVMVESTKVLKKCRCGKDFYGTIAHVEAEKILLMSTLIYDTILNKVLKNQYEYLSNKKIARGTIMLNNIQFPILQATYKNNKVPKSFVCVISSGDKIFSTKIMIPGERSIKFHEKFLFDELDWNFQITVTLYYIDFPKRKKSFFGCLKQNDEHDYILKMLRYKDLKTNEIVNNYVTNSSYKLCASTIIELKDVKCGQVLTLNEKTNWLDSLYLDIKLGDVKFNTKWSGFLTMGKNKLGYFMWTRRWCVLQSSTLKIYNYPSEELYSNPIETINLKKIIPPYVTEASRNVCPHPRTIVLYVGYERKRDQHYISTDTTGELKIFRDILEDVITYLKHWNLQVYANED